LFSDSSAQAGLFHVETKLTASDGAAYDYFGISVGISGNVAIVGASGDRDSGANSGSAYLFDVPTGNQLAKLTASDAAEGDGFGHSVAISGNTAIIGAPGDDDFGRFSGSAYLFDTTTGSQLAKLTASDAAAFNSFSRSVGISDNIAVVAASGVGRSSGAAYLFDVTTGNQLAKLTPSDATEGDFGVSVAVSGNKAIVGAWLDNALGVQSGSAYLFDVTTGNQLAKLTASDGAPFDEFGRSVAISGNIAIVGAFGDDDGGTESGSAYLFDVTTGSQLAKLTASDAAAVDLFGVSVGISGNTAIVGTGDDAGGDDVGAAYLFDVTTGNQLAKLTVRAAADIDRVSVGISGNAAIVGGPFDAHGGDEPGSAYLFTPEPNSLLLCGLACFGPFVRRRKQSAK
jgi:hypothetical protein